MYGLVLASNGSNQPVSPREWLSGFFSWDGNWYATIARDGYEYDPNAPSSVAFFPCYPLLGRLVATLCRIRIDVALLSITYTSLIGAFAVFAAYLRERIPRERFVRIFSLLAFGVFPTTFFFRVGYSEALFVFLTILALYGIEKRWPLPSTACVIALATATRPVGVALLLPFALAVWGRRSSDARRAAMQLVWLVPLSCAGLFAYMTYLYFEFGDPFVFAQTQSNYRMTPPVPWHVKALMLLSWEPIWSVYMPSTSAYWARFDNDTTPILSLQFANPIYFVLTAILIGVGFYKRWLTSYEFLLSTGLLAIPYVTRSVEMAMASQGRFAAVVFPVYIVIGHLLARLPRWAACCLLALSAFLMAAYAAKFAAWHIVI